MGRTRELFEALCQQIEENDYEHFYKEQERPALFCEEFNKRETENPHRNN